MASSGLLRVESYSPPPQFLCWNPNPGDLWTRPYVETGSSQGLNRGDQGKNGRWSRSVGWPWTHPTGVLMKRGAVGNRPQEDEGRAWIDIFISQPRPKISSNHQKLAERQVARSSSWHTEGTAHARTLVSHFQPAEHETINFCSRHCSLYSVLLRQC